MIIHFQYNRLEENCKMRKFELIYYFSGGSQFACEIEAEDMATAGSIAEGMELRLSGCKGYDLYVKKEDK